MRFTYIYLLLTCIQVTNAQDLHWSQALRQPLWLNPAQVGTMSEDARVTAAYRNQWQSVPVPFLSVMMSYDQRAPKLLPTRFGTLGLGGMAGYDRAGDAGLRWSMIGLGASFSRVFAEANTLSLGVMWSGMQRAVRPNLLSFGSQYNGAQFDPNTSNNETFEALSANTNSFSVGLQYQGAVASERFRWQLGVAMYHVNAPTYHFTSLTQQTTPEVLPRISTQGALWVRANEKLTYLAWVAAQRQGKYNEIVSGVGVRYTLINTIPRRVALQSGVAARVGDALILSAEIAFNEWSVGLSYDINTSPLQVATNRRGGPELTLIYTITKPKPPKAFKSCPIF